MKKKIFTKKFIVCSLILVVFIVGINFFDSKIIGFYWRIKCPTPIEWNNLEIHLDKNMVYKKEKRKIIFAYWNKRPKGILGFSNIKFKNYYEIEKLIKKMKHKIIEMDEKTLWGYKAYYIKHKNNSNHNIYLSIYNLSLNLMINYEGPIEEFKYFDKVINNIKLIS